MTYYEHIIQLLKGETLSTVIKVLHTYCQELFLNTASARNVITTVFFARG